MEAGELRDLLKSGGVRYDERAVQNGTRFRCPPLRKRFRSSMRIFLRPEACCRCFGN
jgi:hypothetical protein